MHYLHKCHDHILQQMLHHSTHTCAMLQLRNMLPALVAPRAATILLHCIALQATSFSNERMQLQQAAADMRKDIKQMRSDMEFQDAEMVSLKQAVATQVDELVR